jgi:hypothetical protein
MKIPSLSYLSRNAGHAFLRFPFSILCGLAGAGVAIYLVENEDQIKNFFPYVNLLLTLGLGISIFFCADVFSYAKGVLPQKKYLFDVLAALILIGIYFSLPGFESTQNTSVPYIRYTIYSITVHLLIAFIPFLRAGQLNGFWHYNKILFIRILTAALYSAFLYGGLALALGSLDFLFDIDVHDELYLDLFIFIVGVFNTWFFVAGIPEDFKGLEDVIEYPKGIKIFSQYVLLPLLVLYILILYIYAGKIVVLWSWPKGIVSYLIACVAVLGILTLLLIHPYGNLSGNNWIRKFTRAYYFILVPLIALLFIAIGMRINDYGVTVNRYIIVLLGIWLTIVSSYFISGKENIKFIPISLAAILVAVSFGYWGMFSVSERSQVERLSTILEQGNILRADKIQGEVKWLRDSLPKTLLAVDAENTNEHQLSDSLHNEVMSILDYLDYHHGFSSVHEWFEQDVDSIVKENNAAKKRWMRLNEAEVYMRTMGLTNVYKYPEGPNSYFTYRSKVDGITDVQGFDYLIDVNSQYENPQSSVYAIGPMKYTFLYPTPDSNKLLLISPTDSMKFDTDELLKRLTVKYGADYDEEIPIDEMSVDVESKRLAARLQINRLSIEARSDTFRVNYVTGIILLKMKK